MILLYEQGLAEIVKTLQRYMQVLTKQPKHLSVEPQALHIQYLPKISTQTMRIKIFKH